MRHQEAEARQQGTAPHATAHLPLVTGHRQNGTGGGHPAAAAGSFTSC